MSFPTSETRSLRSSSFMGEGPNRAAQLPLDGLQLGRSRSRTWTPQHRRSSGGFANRRLDEWLFPIEDEEAYATWVSGPRQQWLQSVQRYGGFRGWLLEGLELRGMDDKNYLLGLRWLSGVALPHSAQADWAQRKAIAEEIEKDVPRTFPGHPCEAALARSSRDILRMLCCARNVTVGYTQGLNFTAAVLSCTMGRDEAFWCLTALAEWVAAHFVSGNMLQGAVADCECIDWLASQLEPKLFALCRSSEGYSSVIFARPLCTLLSCCGLPVDATLQCWRAILHSSNPRIFLLRTLAAFVLQTAARLAASSGAGSGAALELPELMEALQKTFQQTYDAQGVLSAAAASVEILPDSTLSKKLEEIEQRLQQSAAESHQRRQMENQKLQEKRLKQLVLEDRSARQSLLREMQLLWRHERHRDVSQLDFLMLLAADHLDGFLTVKSSTWEAFLSTVFVDLDSSHSGMVLLKHALIAVALLLGETPLERVSAIFSMLEIEGLCLRDDFLELAEATGQENSASEWLVANGITENLNQNVFIKALLALPSLALATCYDSTPGNAGSFSISFTSSSGTLLPVAPKWVPDEQQVACQLCSTSFTCCRRRHHCRACGRLTCRQCSGQRLALAIIGYPNPVRVCDECFFVLSPAV